MTKPKTKTNEQIACNNWEKIGMLKEKERTKKAISKFRVEKMYHTPSDDCSICFHQLVVLNWLERVLEE